MIHAVDIKNEHRALRAYLKRRGMTQKQFGKLLGVSQSQVSQWLTGKKSINGDWAPEIERKTKGDFRREDVRPDLYRRVA